MADDDAYELIMQDKERLLDEKEPVRFIFSHSALREGWDNPNVFQICTLREMGAETERRQTLGRGLRLPVSKTEHGYARVADRGIATLTVVANESYTKFADALQKEYKDDRQKLNEELMKFYKENNINPLGGCLPLLAQMPVFIILFRTLRGLSIEYAARLGTPVPLSYNALKPSQRFLNLRARGVGLAQAMQPVHALEAQLALGGELCVKKIIAEYICFDSNRAVDNGWLEPLP